MFRDPQRSLPVFVFAIVAFTCFSRDRLPAQGPAGKTVTAEELTRAFMDNESAARKKYGGLVSVQVEGVVNKKGEAIVYLKGATDRLGVACEFDAKQSKEAATVKVGQKFSAVGAGYGILAHV